jgi:hypothetical protein
MFRWLKKKKPMAPKTMVANSEIGFMDVSLIRLKDH